MEGVFLGVKDVGFEAEVSLAALEAVKEFLVHRKGVIERCAIFGLKLVAIA